VVWKRAAQGRGIPVASIDTEAITGNMSPARRVTQWETIFEDGDKKGMFLHFSSVERENDNMMEENSTGLEGRIRICDTNAGHVDGNQGIRIMPVQPIAYTSRSRI